MKLVDNSLFRRELREDEEKEDPQTEIKIILGCFSLETISDI